MASKNGEQIRLQNTKIPCTCHLADFSFCGINCFFCYSSAGTTYVALCTSTCTFVLSACRKNRVASHDRRVELFLAGGSSNAEWDVIFFLSLLISFFCLFFSLSYVAFSRGNNPLMTRPKRETRRRALKTYAVDKTEAVSA